MVTCTKKHELCNQHHNHYLLTLISIYGGAQRSSIVLRGTDLSLGLLNWIIFVMALVMDIPSQNSLQNINNKNIHFNKFMIEQIVITIIFSKYFIFSWGLIFHK